jgi:hypothetical protein
MKKTLPISAVRISSVIAFMTLELFHFMIGLVNGGGIPSFHNLFSLLLSQSLLCPMTIFFKMIEMCLLSEQISIVNITLGI